MASVLPVFLEVLIELLELLLPRQNHEPDTILRRVRKNPAHSECPKRQRCITPSRRSKLNPSLGRNALIVVWVFDLYHFGDQVGRIQQ